MKRHILFCLFLNVFGSAYPQNTTPSQDQNYIKTRTYTKDDANASLDVVQYFDGLGRSMQTVRQNVGPTSNNQDLIFVQEYDAFGRESKTGLPIPRTGSSGTYYTGGITPNSVYNNDNYAYLETKYEPSPLNRVEKQYGSGQAWRTADRPVKTDYWINNSTNYPCRYYSVSGDNLVKNASDYTNGSLYVTQTTDEDNKISYEFLDKLDRMIMQRQVDTDGNYDTYYVYDDFNNLRFVLPPMIADDISSDQLNNYAYIYKYDYRQRCTEKKLPGAEPVYHVYDKADRLIFSQDGEQRTSKSWSFNKYDAFGRIIASGVWKNSNQLQSDLVTLVQNAVVVETDSVNGEMGYTKRYLKEIPNGSMLLANYYDNSDHFLNTLDATTKGKVTYTALSDFDSHYVNSDCSSKGLVVGIRTKMLDDNSKEIVTAFYYDAKKRVVQQKSTNLLGGNESEYYVYSFTGNPMKKQRIHTAAGKSTITENYMYEYDHADRLTTTTYQLDSNTPVTLSILAYDNLGRLKEKKLHGEKETIAYTYNIRNWLEKINSTNFRENLIYTGGYNNNVPMYNGNISVSEIFWKMQNEYTSLSRAYMYTYDGLNRMTKGVQYTNGSQQNIWNEELVYDKQGNIVELTRNAPVSQGSNNYNSEHLYLSYIGNQLNTTGTSAGVYNPMTQNSYNKNGALTVNPLRNISNIQYNLLNLPDKIKFNAGSSTQYSYDATGMKRRVRHIEEENTAVVTSGIPVNPHIRIRFSLVESYHNQTVTDYCGNVIYENGKLKYILTPEGYVTKNENAVIYNYYLKDHLGNNRVVLEVNGSNTAVIQKTDYYPFGMPYADNEYPERQPYKFGGKELDEMYGLNWYDFEARHLEAMIPRFTTMDPLAEKYYSISPYAYCGNNPVTFVDPDGRTVYFYTLTNKGDTYYNQVTFDQLDQATKEMFYGWASSKAGQKFLSNFVDGEQTFTLDGSNSLSIKGNGNNFDAKYRFGESTMEFGSDGSVSTVHGYTKWDMKNDKLTMTLKVDVKDQNFENQVMAFGHETTVHAQNDIDYINQNYPQGVGLNKNNVGQLNNDGIREHTNYMYSESREYRAMRNYYFGMRGWLGGTPYTTDARLRKAFSNEILNNRKNVTGK